VEFSGWIGLKEKETLGWVNDILFFLLLLLLSSKKKPELLFAARAFQNITPQMPLRRISRSLSVTGG
jgi:hypothetical protein